MARCWVLRERAPALVGGVCFLWVAAAVNRFRVVCLVGLGLVLWVWGVLGAGCGGRRRVVVAGSVGSLRTA